MNVGIRTHSRLLIKVVNSALSRTLPKACESDEYDLFFSWEKIRLLNIKTNRNLQQVWKKYNDTIICLLLPLIQPIGPVRSNLKLVARSLKPSVHILRVQFTRRSSEAHRTQFRNVHSTSKNVIKNYLRRSLAIFKAFIFLQFKNGNLYSLIYLFKIRGFVVTKNINGMQIIKLHYNRLFLIMPNFWEFSNATMNVEICSLSLPVSGKAIFRVHGIKQYRNGWYIEPCQAIAQTLSLPILERHPPIERLRRYGKTKKFMAFMAFCYHDKFKRLLLCADALKYLTSIDNT